MVQAWERKDFLALALFDVAGGVLDRRKTSDEAIYQLELERIFARGWNFMCDDSLRDPGDDLVIYIGEDEVILVHGEQGEINVPAAIAATR